MTIQEELNLLLATLPARGVKIVYKDRSWFWKALGFLVLIFTFGKNKDFVNGFVTTINKTIAVPRSWDSASALLKLETLTHELHHVDQYKKYTPFVMGFLYLFVFFPIGLAYFRYRFEREAYVIGYKKTLERVPTARARLIDEAVLELTGGNYGYAWVFPGMVRTWFEKNL